MSTGFEIKVNGEFSPEFVGGVTVSLLLGQYPSMLHGYKHISKHEAASFVYQAPSDNTLALHNIEANIITDI